MGDLTAGTYGFINSSNAQSNSCQMIIHNSKGRFKNPVWCHSSLQKLVTIFHFAWNMHSNTYMIQFLIHGNVYSISFHKYVCIILKVIWIQVVVIWVAYRGKNNCFWYFLFVVGELHCSQAFLQHQTLPIPTPYELVVNFCLK
jgi:hypothetical protein